MRPRYVHVGSMNIEHFGREDDRAENKFAIAEHIEMSGVHVLALQELYVTNDIQDGGARLENSFLSDALSLIRDHTGDVWEYEIFRNRNANDRSQLCGIAWNTSRVKKLAPAFKIDLPKKVQEGDLTLNLWDRRPHAVHFRALPGEDSGVELTDFVVISLHMKSNVGPRRQVMRTRAHEVIELMNQCGAIEQEFGEKDLIFIGDTNCKSRNEDAIQAFVDAGFEDLNTDDISTFYRGSDAPFDRIFVPADRRAFTYSRQYVLRSASPLAHDRFLSDHYMIKTSIVVRRDMDDE